MAVSPAILETIRTFGAELERTLDKEHSIVTHDAGAPRDTIMPFYTANQADNAEAETLGRGGSNNFSNINATLQARLFSKALRDYSRTNPALVIKGGVLDGKALNSDEITKLADLESREGLA